MTPQLNKVTKVLEKSHISVYDLEYTNRAGKPKIYSIISRNELTPDNIATPVENAVTAFAINKDRTKVLLLNEFRMGVNEYVYNTVSGLIDEGETALDALYREMKEEVGLPITQVLQAFPASYSSVGISDETVTPFIVEVEEGQINQQLEDNENITPEWFTISQMEELLMTHKVGARTQLFGYMFISGLFNKQED